MSRRQEEVWTQRWQWGQGLPQSEVLGVGWQQGQDIFEGTKARKISPTHKGYLPPRMIYWFIDAKMWWGAIQEYSDLLKKKRKIKFLKKLSEEMKQFFCPHGVTLTTTCPIASESKVAPLPADRADSLRRQFLSPARNLGNRMNWGRPRENEIYDD